MHYLKALYTEQQHGMLEKFILFSSASLPLLNRFQFLPRYFSSEFKHIKHSKISVIKSRSTKHIVKKHHKFMQPSTTLHHHTNRKRRSTTPSINMTSTSAFINASSDPSTQPRLHETQLASDPTTTSSATPSNNANANTIATTHPVVTTNIPGTSYPMISDVTSVNVQELRPLPVDLSRVHINPARISKIVFLGTGSAVPSPNRNTSAMVIVLTNGSQILMDCGEGTQIQMMKSRSVNVSKIETILLTHLHGDHCYGIFGLLHTLAVPERTVGVNIIGPVGIKRMLEAVYSITGGFWSLPLHIHEIPTNTHMSNILLNHDSNVLISAAPLVHRVPTFGYSIQEQTRAGAMLAGKAKSLGVYGSEFSTLKSGKDVTLADGTVVKSADVLAPPQVGRKVCLLQDTANSDAAMDICRDADVLIHEATYDESMREKSILFGHSTGAMAGEYAKKVNAKLLVLTHFSGRYNLAYPPTTSTFASTSASYNQQQDTGSVPLNRHTDQHLHNEPMAGSGIAKESSATMETIAHEAAHATSHTVPVVAVNDFDVIQAHKDKGFVLGEADRFAKDFF